MMFRTSDRFYGVMCCRMLNSRADDKTGAFDCIIYAPV